MPTGTAWSQKSAANRGTGGATSSQRSQPHWMRPCCVISCQLSQSFKRCLNTGILLWNSVLKYSSLVFLNFISVKLKLSGEGKFHPPLPHLSGVPVAELRIKLTQGASLIFQWFGVHTPNAGSTVWEHRFNPWSGNKIRHAAWFSQKKKKMTQDRLAREKRNKFYSCTQRSPRNGT